jgi:hypothetical protein
LAETVNQADQSPTAAMQVAFHDYCQDLSKVTQQWSDLMKQDLPTVNTQLTGQKVQPLTPVMETATASECGQ